MQPQLLATRLTETLGYPHSVISAGMGGPAAILCGMATDPVSMQRPAKLLWRA